MERIWQPDRDHTDSLTDPISDLSNAHCFANAYFHTSDTHRNSGHANTSAYCDTCTAFTDRSRSNTDCTLPGNDYDHTDPTIERAEHHSEYCPGKHHCKFDVERHRLCKWGNREF